MPLDPKKYVRLTHTDTAVSFDYEQFARLVGDRLFVQCKNGSAGHIHHS
jgi:hypothetical protein